MYTTIIRHLLSGWKRPALSPFICCVVLILGWYPANAQPDRNFDLYAAVRDYIQTDTTAWEFLKHPGPFKTWVLDDVTCVDYIYYWDIEGWIEWMGLSPRDEEDYKRIEDSLRSHALPMPCSADPNLLGDLSTTGDIRYVLKFGQIDSVFFPGKYIVSATLWDNMSRHSAGFDIQGVGKIYFIILDRNCHVLKVFHGDMIMG